MHIYLKSELFKPALFEVLFISWPRQAIISLFADLMLPEKFPSTACFIQSTTIKSSNTLKKRLSALHFPFRREEARQPNGEQQ